MNRLAIFNKKISKGFTLIELLIVIAVIGILAAVVLVAIDPIEQLARGRDAGRKSAVVELGRALQANFTVNGAYLPLAGWTADPATNGLVLSGDIKSIPSQTVPIPATTCTGGVIVNNFCYKSAALPAAPNIVMYTHVESKSERNKGSCAGSGPNTWYVYASLDGRAGIVCLPASVEPIATTSYTGQYN